MSYLLIGIHTDKFNVNKFEHFNDEVLDDSVKDYYFKSNKFRVIDLDTLDIIDLDLENIINNNLKIRCLYVDYSKLNRNTKYLELNIFGCDKSNGGIYEDYNIPVILNGSFINYVGYDRHERTFVEITDKNDSLVFSIDLENLGVAIFFNYVLVYNFGNYIEVSRNFLGYRYSYGYNCGYVYKEMNFINDLCNFIDYLDYGIYYVYGDICYIDRHCSKDYIVVPDGIKVLACDLEFDNGVQSIVLPITVDTFLVSNYKNAKNKLKVYVNEAKVVDIVIDFLANYGNYRGLDSLYDLSIKELIKVSKDNCGVEFELYR
jgi:hypothetical protein